MVALFSCKRINDGLTGACLWAARNTGVQVLYLSGHEIRKKSVLIGCHPHPL
jgi:hypothetical protein